MKKRLIAPLLFALWAVPSLAQTQAEIDDPEIALECAGTIKTDKPPSLKKVTRTYIIREGRKQIMYWNPELGSEIDLCPVGDDHCFAQFHPFKFWMHHPDSGVMMIDRRSGSIWHLMGGGRRFDGICKVVPIPTAKGQKTLF